MNYSSLIALMLLTTNAYAIDFTIMPGSEDSDGNNYYSLMVKEGSKSKNIDVMLENNATTAELKNKLSISCPWGRAEGIRVNMSTSSVDGILVTDQLYFFNNNLDNIFAKSYAKLKNTEWKQPLSLNHSVCENLVGGVKKDNRLGKDYLENSEMILQGPFALKGVANVDIKYIFDGKLKLIREDSVGDSVVEAYEEKDNNPASVKTVFLIPKLKGGELISLISWGDESNQGNSMCYKVYAYSYNNEELVAKNAKIDNDKNLSMCESKGKAFKYKTALDIKKYILENESS